MAIVKFNHALAAQYANLLEEKLANRARIGMFGIGISLTTTEAEVIRSLLNQASIKAAAGDAGREKS